jgi:zinc protease
LISEDELTRVKAQIIAANMYEQDSLMNQVLDLGAVEALGLSWKVSDDFVKNIQAVTASQIQTVAKEYFKSERLTVGYLQPKTS